MKLINCPKCSVQYDATGYQPGMQFQCTNCHAFVVVPSQTGGLQPQQVVTMPAEGADYEGLDFDPDETAAAELPEVEAPKPGVKKKKKKKKAAGATPGKAQAGAAPSKGRPSKKGASKAGATKGGAAKGGTARRAAGGGAGAGGGARGGTRRTAAGTATRGGGRYQPGQGPQDESKKLAIIIGSVIGVVLLLAGAIILSNTGSEPPVVEEETEEEDGPQLSEIELRRQRLEPLQNHEAVKDTAEAFVNALKQRDTRRVHEIIDQDAFFDLIENNFGPALDALDLSAEEFFHKYYDPDGRWGDHYARHEVVADPDPNVVIDGEAHWYFSRQNVGRARYLATRDDGRANPYHIGMAFELDEEGPAWKLTSYDNPEYRPWDLDMDEATAQGRPHRGDGAGGRPDRSGRDFDPAKMIDYLVGTWIPDKETMREKFEEHGLSEGEIREQLDDLEEMEIVIEEASVTIYANRRVRDAFDIESFERGTDRVILHLRDEEETKVARFRTRDRIHFIEVTGGELILDRKPGTGVDGDAPSGRGDDRIASGIEPFPEQSLRNLEPWQRSLIVDQLSRNAWGRARQIISERGPDRDISAWLINRMINEYERDRPTAPIARNYCRMLAAMYSFDLEEETAYMWLTDDDYDREHNREVIMRWRDEHFRHFEN